MQERLNKVFKAWSVLVQDWLKYEISRDSLRYLRIRNRMEKLSAGPISNSYACLWPYTSRLKVIEEWPYIGNYLLRRVVRDNEFKFADYRDTSDTSDISIIIGHRGLERIDLLLTTIKSLAAQREARIECIVVEQDSIIRIQSYLPEWVRYIFQRTDGGKGNYNRSAAFNLGARSAQGGVLLLHDNDMIVPTSYCYDILKLIEEGYQALNTKRFVFYLSEEDTKRVQTSLESINSSVPLYIVQNLEAGGSMAITKEAYFDIGGMDEDFVGWGGEDNEFWRRCSHLKRWIWGFTPIIHLWHESQPLKRNTKNENVERARMLENVTIEDRIRVLRERNQFIIEKKGLI